MALLRGASARSHFARLRYWPHCHAVAGTSEATTCRALAAPRASYFFITILVFLPCRLRTAEDSLLASCTSERARAPPSDPEVSEYSWRESVD